MIKIVEDNNITYAKVIRAGHVVENTEFFTDDNAELQFGIIKKEKNRYQRRKKMKKKEKF